MSSLGTGYELRIQVNTSAQPEIIQLIGTDNPFETSEDTSDNIFLPIRSQSGKINIVTDDRTLIRDLMPANSTQRKVELLLRGDVVWSGFLSADVYSQPYEAGKIIFSLPCISTLRALESIQVPSSYYGSSYSILELIQQMRYSLGLSTGARQLYFVSRLQNINTWMNCKIYMSLFFKTEDNYDEDVQSIQLTADNFRTVLSNILSMMGFCIRERGTAWIIFDAVDTSLLSSSNYYMYTLSSGSISEVTTINCTTLSTLLNYIGGNKARESYMSGVKRLSIELNIVRDSVYKIELPPAPDGIEAVQGGQEENNPTTSMRNQLLYMQPHEPVVRSTMFTEVCTFLYQSLYKTPGASIDAIFTQSDSDYEEMSPHTAFGEDLHDCYDDQYGISYRGYIGAFPCKWAEGENTSDMNFQSGMLLNCLNIVGVANYYGATGTSSGTTEIYSITSKSVIDVNHGYINVSIKAKYLSYYKRGFEGDDVLPIFHVYIGNTNILSSTGRYHITRQMHGSLRVVFHADDRYPTTSPTTRSFILESVVVEWMDEDAAIGLSDRSSNNYIKIINQNFTGSENINLNLGTKLASNLPSISFLMNNDTTEFTNTFQWGSVVIIPERRLIDVMRRHYEQKRRKLEIELRLEAANLVGNADIYRTNVIDENNKKCLALEKSHKWSSDIVKLDLIEIM